MFAGRSLTHIKQKSLKGIEPPVANHNSSAAISVEFDVAFIKASVFHPGPNAVFG
jgi:hypothetical protein